MPRPTLMDITSGVGGWDALINANKDATVNAPFPLCRVAELSELNSNFPANMYEDCFALVQADGLIYVSDGSSWEAYRQAENVDPLTDNTGGTVADTLAALATSVTGVDGSGNNAASKADVDTALGIIANSLSSISAKLNEEISAIKAASLQSG